MPHFPVNGRQAAHSPLALLIRSVVAGARRPDGGPTDGLASADEGRASRSIGRCRRAREREGGRRDGRASLCIRTAPFSLAGRTDGRRGTAAEKEKGIGGAAGEGELIPGLSRSTINDTAVGQLARSLAR